MKWPRKKWIGFIIGIAIGIPLGPLLANSSDHNPVWVNRALAGLLLLVGDRVFEPRQVAVAGVVIAAATTAVIWRARNMIW